MDRIKESEHMISGRAADRFLAACLLLLLSKGASHGYALMEQITLFGYSQDNLSPSTLYRTLRYTKIL